ncbi:hypothetical protein ACFE04_016566 [Oxalis oulophora]
MKLLYKEKARSSNGNDQNTSPPLLISYTPNSTATQSDDESERDEGCGFREEERRDGCGEDESVCLCAWTWYLFRDKVIVGSEEVEEGESGGEVEGRRRGEGKGKGKERVAAIKTVSFDSLIN